VRQAAEVEVAHGFQELGDKTRPGFTIVVKRRPVDARQRRVARRVERVQVTHGRLRHLRRATCLRVTDGERALVDPAQRRRHRVRLLQRRVLAPFLDPCVDVVCLEDEVGLLHVASLEPLYVLDGDGP